MIFLLLKIEGKIIWFLYDKFFRKSDYLDKIFGWQYLLQLLKCKIHAATQLNE